jgi:WD40 repeat protein
VNKDILFNKNNFVKLLLILFILASAEILSPLPRKLEYNDKELIQFNLPKGSKWWMAVSSVPLGFDGAVTAIRYTPDGDKMIASSDSGELALADLNTGIILWKTPKTEREYRVFVLDISPDGSVFAVSRALSSASDKKDDPGSLPLEIRETATGKLIKKINGFSGFYHFHKGNDGKIFEESDLRRNEKNLELYKKQGYYLFSMKAVSAKFTNDGRSLLVHWANDREDLSLIDHQFQLIDLVKYDEIWSWQYVNDRVDICSSGTQNAKIDEGIIYAPLIYDKNRERLIYAVPDGEIRAINISTVVKSMKIENVHYKPAGELIFDMRKDADWQPSALSISPDGKFVLVTVMLDGSEHIELIDLEAKKRVLKSPRINNISGTYFSPDGKYVIGYGMGGGQLLIWDDAGKLAGDWPRFGGGGFFATDINPVKKEIASVIKDSIILITEREKKDLNCKAGKYTPAGVYIKEGTDIYFKGTGLLKFKSGNLEINKVFHNDIEGYTSSSDELYDMSDKGRWGEVFIQADSSQNLTFYGGLSKEEFGSQEGLRSHIPSWNK